MIAVVLSAESAHAVAQQLSLPEAIKAAQLYKFASFVAWPDTAFASPTMPLELCVVGNPTVASAVARAADGQTVNGRSFAVRDIRASEAESCHVVYLSGLSPDERAAIVARLIGHPVLTVTDDAGGTGRGVVNFLLRDNHVRFQIDNATAARNGLMVSARLLALAVPQ